MGSAVKGTKGVKGADDRKGPNSGVTGEDRPCSGGDSEEPNIPDGGTARARTLHVGGTEGG